MNTIYLYVGETATHETPIEEYEGVISLIKDEALLGESGNGYCAVIELEDETIEVLELFDRLSVDGKNTPLIDHISELATKMFCAGVKFAQKEARKSLGL